MKILVINRYYWPDKSADSRIIHEISKFLANKNHEVDVITSPLIDKKKKDSKKLSSQNIFKNLKVFRLSLSKETLSPLSRIVNAIKMSFFVFIKSLERNYDVILVTTIPPILSGFFSTIVAKIIKARVIYYCMDLNPEIGGLSGDFKNKYLYKLLFRLDHWTCQKANPVLVHSVDMLKTLRSRRGGKKYNIQIMNNFSPLSKKKFNTNLNNKINSKDLNIIYTGNLGRFQSLETIIKAMSLLKHKRNIKLIIMGNGILKKKLINMTMKSKANIKFLNTQPIEIAKDVIKKSDICLVSLVPKMFKYAYPSKIMTYLEQGRPIIFLVEKQSEMVKCAISEGYGFHLLNRKEKTIANLFEKLAKNKKWKKKMEKNANKAFKKNFSTDSILTKWSNVVETGKVN